MAVRAASVFGQAGGYARWPSAPLSRVIQGPASGDFRPRSGPLLRRSRVWIKPENLVYTLGGRFGRCRLAVCALLIPDHPRSAFLDLGWSGMLRGWSWRHRPKRVWLGLGWIGSGSSGCTAGCTWACTGTMYKRLETMPVGLPVELPVVQALLAPRTPEGSGVFHLLQTVTTHPLRSLVACGHGLFDEGPVQGFGEPVAGV